jgi:hypothetical protein
VGGWGTFNSHKRDWTHIIFSRDCLIYTSSSRMIWRNVFWTSSCRKVQPRDTAIDRTVLIVAAFTTGLNVSSYSIPYRYLKSLATNQALFLSNEPSAFRLTLYTHLQSMIFLIPSDGTKCHVWFFSKASYSASIANFQFRSSSASERLCGSPVELKRPYLTWAVAPSRSLVHGRWSV